MGPHRRALTDDENGERFVHFYRLLSDAGLGPEVLSVSPTEIVTEMHQVLSAWLNEHPSHGARVEMAIAIRGLLLQAHDLGFCHRDVHIDNIVITRFGQPLLIDPAFAVPTMGTPLCYDLVGPESSGVPTPPEHAHQPGHALGVWWDAPVAYRTLGRNLVPLADLLRQ